MLSDEDRGGIRGKKKDLWRLCKGGHGEPVLLEAAFQTKIGIFTKAQGDLTEEKQEISLIREKEKTHRNNIVFVLIQKHEMCFGTHPKCLFNKKSKR